MVSYLVNSIYYYKLVHIPNNCHIIQYALLHINNNQLLIWIWILTFNIIIIISQIIIP